MASCYFAVSTFFLFRLFGRWLSPVGPRDSLINKAQGATVRSFKALPLLCYPYFHMFREAVGGGALISEFYMPDLHQVRLCYLYGEAKNTTFHTQAGLRALDKAPGSSQKAIKHAGHWLYVQEPQACASAMRAFIGS